MRLTEAVRLMMTSPLLRKKFGKPPPVKKSKAEKIVVKCESVVSKFAIHRIRPRLDEKLEFMCWDPMVQEDVLYREIKKIRSVPYDKKNTQQIYPCQFDQPIQKETRWYRLHTCLDPSSHGYYDDHPEEDVKAEKKALLKKMQEEKAAKRR